MTIENAYQIFLDEHSACYDLESVKAEKDHVFNSILDDYLADNKAKGSELISKVLFLCTLYEQQGFTYGFKSGLELQKEVDRLA